MINNTFWCLLFFEGKKRSVLSKVTEINELSYEFGNYYKRKGYYLSIMLSCDIPKDIKDFVPKAVAIKTNTKCKDDLNNLLRVIYDRPVSGKVEKFGVCVRALYYHNNDFSLRLIEWLELMRILGSNKVFLYSFSIHPNMNKVINYYQNLGVVDWRQTTHPGGQINNKYLDELYANKMGNRLFPQETLELNDCLYKNLYKYQYLVYLDIDEVIIPVSADNWTQMMDQIYNSLKIPTNKSRFGSYVFTQTRFYDDLETDEYNTNPFMHTMRHLFRANFTPNAPKSFQITKNIKVVWNHSPTKCFINKDNDKCPLRFVGKDIGYLLHYRPGIDKPKNCSFNDLKKCAIFDPIITKYNTVLEKHMIKAIENIF